MAALGSLVLLGSAAIVPCFVLLGGQPALPSFGGVFRAAADSAGRRAATGALTGGTVVARARTKGLPCRSERSGADAGIEAARAGDM